MREINQPKAPMVDRAISWLAPIWGARRAMAREAINRIGLSYRGGVPDRFTRDYVRRSAQPFARPADASLQSLRDRAEDLVKNNPIAEGLVSQCVANVVSTGFDPRPKTSDEAWNVQAKALMVDWMDYRADARGMSSFQELQSMAVRTRQVQGDCGFVLVNDGSVQLIEGDRIETPPSLAGRMDITDGVELDRLGRPLAFYIATPTNDDPMKFARVPARDFIFWPRRIAECDTRGTPVFASTATLFDQLEGYIEATLTAAQMSAMFALVFKQANNPIAGLTEKTRDSGGNERKTLRMEPGQFYHLRPGEDVTPINPAYPAQQFDSFVVSLLRLIGLPWGIPLELVMLNFSRTNYSSSRASLLQAQRTFTCLQRSFIRSVLSRIYRWRISKFIKDGELPEREDAWTHTWGAPGWAWVDPAKEVDAYLAAIKGNIRTHESVISSLGEEWEAVFEQRAREEEAIERLGIKPADEQAPEQPADPEDDNEDDNPEDEQ